MKILQLILLVTLAGPAPGQYLSCGLSERIDGKLFRPGVSERRVLEAEPDRIVRLETREGGAAGYRYEFYVPGRTVQVYVSQGVVVRVCRVRE